MDAQTCILTRRSHRKFTGEAVSRQEIEKIVSLASYAPSWKNTQISRYIAIEDEGTRAEGQADHQRKILPPRHQQRRYYQLLPRPHRPDLYEKPLRL